MEDSRDSNGDQKTEAHGGNVENPLSDHEADREENIGGWKEGDHQPGGSQQNLSGEPAGGGGCETGEEEGEEDEEDDDDPEEPEVRHGGEERDGAHGPVTAQLVRAEEEPEVDAGQEREGEGLGWLAGLAGRVVELSEDWQTGSLQQLDPQEQEQSEGEE